MASRNFLLVVPVIAAALMPGFGKAAPSAQTPDFTGYWIHPSIPGVEPLASGPTSLTNRSRRDGQNNILQLVGDYTNPILKPAAAARVKMLGEQSIAHFGFHNPRNQCWPNGVPFMLPLSMEMFPQPDQIVIIYQNDHQVRHIRMNAQHPAKVKPSWYGDSVGRYEGDTLVIDTVGMKLGPFAMVDWYGTPQTEALHVVERYRLVDYEQAKDGLARDAKENFQVAQETINPNYRGKHLQLEFTVEDKGVFTTPWTATMTYRPQVTPWEESICAENPNKFGTEKDVAVPTARASDF